MGISDADLARSIAERAGAALIELRAGEGFADAPGLRDRGDRSSHDLILAALRDERPQDAVLSEEGADDAGRLSAARVWIVDPLDGTREFGEEGRSDWAVHIALVVEGVPVAAAVGLPAEGVVLGSSPRPPTPGDHPGKLRLVASRSHTPPEIHAIAGKLDADLVLMGSAGAKTMAVVRGQADAYVHLGGQYEWDSAAPVGVAMAAGLHTSRADGSALRYNQPNPWLPDQVVCRREVVDTVMAAVAEVRAAG